MKSYKHIYSLFMALWIVVVFTVQTLHHAGVVEHTHTTHSCEGDHEHTHDHDEETCGLCDFYFQVSTLTDITQLSLWQSVSHYDPPKEAYTSYTSLSPHYISLRAPPM